MNDAKVTEIVNLHASAFVAKASRVAILLRDMSLNNQSYKPLVELLSEMKGHVDQTFVAKELLHQARKVVGDE